MGAKCHTSTRRCSTLARSDRENRRVVCNRLKPSVMQIRLLFTSDCPTLSSGACGGLTPCLYQYLSKPKIDIILLLARRIIWILINGLIINIYYHIMYSVCFILLACFKKNGL